MKKLLISLLSILMIVLVTNCNQDKQANSEADQPAKKVMSEQELIAQGEYLVSVMGCADCHCPKMMTDNGPVPDKDRLLMGYPSDDKLPAINKDEVGMDKWILFNGDLTASVGPWGVSFAANLTPDQTGIGAWPYENFKRAITKGLFKGIEGSRMLYPPMPWQNYANLKEDDIKAIYQYLKSIKPISNVVPGHIPPDEME